MKKITIDSDIFSSSPSLYVLFKKLPTKDSAQELVDFLSQHAIDFEVEESIRNFELDNYDKESSKEYYIKLKKQDFKQAQQLLDEHSLSQIDAMDKDYPLFNFTDEELMEVLMKPDEWNTLDPLLAAKLLKDRGKEITAVEIVGLKQQRINELSRPDEDQRWWIIIAYISALLGGLLGILIGWHLSSHKKTLPNGERIYSYSLRDRAHGQYIMIIGVFCLIIVLLIKFISQQ